MILELFLFAFQFISVQSYEVCSPRWYSYKYCDDGYYCCHDDKDCCPDLPLSIGSIVGIVIGGIIFISGVITIICVCAQQGKRRPGRTVVPQQGTTVAFVGQTGQQPMYGQQPYGQQPYGYGQPQAGYGQQQAAYGQPHGGNGHPQGGPGIQPNQPEYPPPPPAYHPAPTAHS